MNISTRKPTNPRRRRADDGAAQFRTAVRHMVEGGRQRGLDDAGIRAEVVGAFRQAVEAASGYRPVVEGTGCSSPDEWAAVRDCLDGQGPRRVCSYAGIFRIVADWLGFDDRRPDDMTAESWWSVVERALDETLRFDEGDFERRAGAG